MTKTPRRRRKLWQIFSIRSPEGKFIKYMDPEIKNLHSRYKPDVKVEYGCPLLTGPPPPSCPCGAIRARGALSVSCGVDSFIWRTLSAAPPPPLLPAPPVVM